MDGEEESFSLPPLKREGSAFASGSHPAFSTFSHIEDVQQLTFAVGLREDAAHAEEYVRKILPMCRYVPGKATSERSQQSMLSVKACKVNVNEVPEVIEAKARLEAILAGNRKLEKDYQRAKEKMLETEATLKSIEKRSSVLDDSIDDLTEILMERKNLYLAACLDAEAARKENIELTKAVKDAEDTLAKYNKELKDKEDQLEVLEKRSDLEVVFGDPHSTTDTSKGAFRLQPRERLIAVKEVQSLPP